MKLKIFLLRLFMFFIMMFSVSSTTGFCSSGDQNFIKPFRVIVIIGDQWQDPMSYMVTSPEAPSHDFAQIMGNTLRCYTVGSAVSGP